MIRSITRITTPAFLSLGLLAALVSPASAADRYGVIGLTNRTNLTIKFQYKVGNGQWVNKTIAPGAKLWFSHEYERINERRSPNFLIRFDSDLRRGENFSTEYRLERRAAVGQSYDYGKKYSLVYDKGDRNFLDVVAID